MIDSVSLHTLAMKWVIAMRVPNHQISRKPTTGPTPGKYVDYYEKIKTYIAIICSPAQAVDHTVTPYTHPVVVPDEEEDSVFNYLDTATTKAGIVAANRKLEGQKVAIVGAGGTGGYVLDCVAKTPIAEIHLFDHDVFLNHNTFRCPGAPSLDDLSKKQAKVDSLASVYSRMRNTTSLRRRLSALTGSASLRADAAESALCAYLSIRNRNRIKTSPVVGKAAGA